MPQQQIELADLAGAKMPADRGLTGLGLLMQLAGSAFLTLGAYIAVAPLMQGAGPGGPRLEIFLIGVLSAIRSISHRSAGMALVYGGAKGYLHNIKVYFGISLAQSLAVGLILLRMGAPGKMAVFVVAVLMTWPAIVMAMLSSKRYRSLGREVPASEDMGFESAAVLMTIFGLMGTIAGGSMLLSVFKTAGTTLTEVPGILWTCVLLMLFVRSALHLRAGWQGSSGVDADKASQSASSYFNFGVISAVIASAVLMLQMIMGSPGLGLEFFIVIAMAGYLLLIWPSAVRMFFTDRNFSMLLDEGKTHRRAPDSGLTALGWLLLANGGVALVYNLGSLLLVSNDGAELGMFAPDMYASDGLSDWAHILLAAIQAYAGYELVRMSDFHKIAATAAGVATVLVTAYFYWPVLSKLDHLSELGPFAIASGLGPVIVGIPVGIATIVLVNRNSDPDARARITA